MKRLKWLLHASSAVALACILSLVIVSDVQAQGPGQFEPADCARFELPPVLEQVRQATCGYVTAPEEYGSQSERTVRLGVVILKSSAADVSEYPLFMMQGGPGGSTIHDFPLFLLLNQDLLRSNRDIILFDQRGTYHSSPRVDCPEQMDLTLKTINQDMSDEEALRLGLESMEACRARLEKEGVNLSAFDSLENAGDVDTIRQALGYEKIDLYGVSYGTLLALQVMRFYPDGLRTVVLDSVVAPQINDMVDGLQPQVRALEMVFAACRQDPDCNQSYPDLERVFYEQVERLNADPVDIQLTDTDFGKTYDSYLDGDSVIYTAIMMMFGTETIPLVPRMIYDVRAGKYAIPEQILSSVTFDRSYSWGMFYSVKCAEEADYTAEQVDDENLPEAFVPLSESSTESFLKTCALWNVEDETAVAGEPVRSEIPTLILSGAFDPTTPPSYAEEVAKTLPNSYSFLFPSGGHGELFSFQCARDLMFAFLDNPSRRPDGGCIPAGNPTFTTRQSVVSVPAILRFVTLQGTAGLELALYAAALGFLLTAVLAYPVIWLFRLARGRAAAPTRSELGYPAPDPASPMTPPAARAKPGPWRFAPWLAVLAGILLLVFTIILAVVLFAMVSGNDTRYLVGVPGSARPLFLLPPLVALLAVGMLFVAVSAWARGWGSGGGRVYFTLLTLAVVVCVSLFGYWGMLTAIVT